MHPWTMFKNGLMTVWYPYVRLLNRTLPSTVVKGKRFAVAPGVYKPLENEHVIADYCKPGERVLDLGCGSGVGAVFCAEKAREVIAVDISAAAVANTRQNCEALGVTNVVARQSDMFSTVDGRFDLILANPPYIAADFADEEKQFATSTRYLPTLFAQAGEYLTADGRMVIQFPIWFRDRIDRLARANGFRLAAVKRMPPKSPGLLLLSMLYLQVGFRSALYLVERMPAAEMPADAADPVRTAA